LTRDAVRPVDGQRCLAHARDPGQHHDRRVTRRSIGPGGVIQSGKLRTASDESRHVDGQLPGHGRSVVGVAAATPLALPILDPVPGGGQRAQLRGLRAEQSDEGVEPVRGRQSPPVRYWPMMV
jgi:hypothetical protein